MDLDVIFIACTIICKISLATAIECFSCAVIPEVVSIGNVKIVKPSCSNFDGSSKYIIDCPYSTMCSRVISLMHLQNGYEQKTTTLGCAQQKRLRHVLHKGKWQPEYSVEEIYSEECKTMKDNNNLIGATKTYCYCRGNLCNSAHQRHVSANLFNSANQRHAVINAYNLLLSFLIIKLFI